MYLKRLTLRGFKSFASATTMDFEPGITCVVGPNGSGKSNVVDALSWVMGEQGAKTLRGGKMEDVIFAGTAKRAPLGRAEVELTIDNSDGALPIEYTEVTLTRTMFRSGGSEYAINGSPARLLDVQELLSDSGIGREMHVIVGQGQLDAILQATPEGRRGFIEEAAGVLKHRKRKEKALRKLDGTRANLERLGDLIAELQRQLKPLGRQAEAARRAAIIQADLRDAKARLLADELAAATRALEAELADEAAVRAARERAEAEVVERAAAEESAEERLRAARADFDAAQEDWYALSGLRERVATTLSVSAERMRLGAEQPALDVGGRDPDALERDAAEIRQRESALAGEVEAAHATLTDATLARNGTEQRHQAAEQAYATALRAIADRREGLARLDGQLGSVRSRLEASGEEVQRLTQRRDEAVARADEAQRGYHAVESSLAGLGANESELDRRLDDATATVASCEERLAVVQARGADLSRERAALEARLEALRLTGERRDGSADLLESGRPGIAGRIPDLIRVEPGWENAVAVALGPAAEALVAGDLDAALAAIEHLSANELGRAPLLLAGLDDGAAPDPGSLAHRVEAADHVRGAVRRALAGAIGVESLAEARAVVRAKPGAIAVTRGGDVVSGWLVEGGSEATGSLLEVAARIAATDEALAACRADLDRVRFEEAAVRADLTAARDDEARALAELHASDAELAAVADTLAGFRQTQSAALKEAERLNDAIAAATLSRGENEQRLADLQARLAAARDEELVDPDPAERDACAADARRARQAEMDARLALRTLEEQAKALSGRAEGLLRAAQAERASRAKARARAEQLAREAEVAAVVNSAAARLADLVEGARALAQAERDRAEQERRDAEAAVTSARHAARAAASRLDELVRGEHRDEMVRIEHRMRIEQLTDRALSELGLDDVTLLAEYGPQVPVPAGEGEEPVPFDREQQTRRLRRAERDLGLLGRINPLALEEFDAMKARHAFLAEQLDDLKRTRADLIDLIAEVDRRVQEVFEAAYRDVERTFGDVFTRLFPGGEGRLVLTEPGDWLNTGVDVEARPAGKQVKRLSLLSGGERSLVAVAFLVSLFIARPSPFYILDEVEAALDDANLGRLLGIYEELRRDSQLIVITHQKRTMEIADSLYGVTMRGDGISAVVSQRLTSE